MDKDIDTDAVCPHCNGNDAVYNDIVCGYHCQLCGRWFGEDQEEEQ